MRATYFPPIAKVNMRKRGPIESKKLNYNSTDLSFTIASLYERVNNSGANLEAMLNKLIYGDPDSNFMGVATVGQSIGVLQSQVKHLKGGERNV